MPPQAGRVGSTSRPRKLRPASALIARCRLFGVDKFEALNGKDDLQTPSPISISCWSTATPIQPESLPAATWGQTPQTFPTLVSWLKIQLA